jgi:Protein of unknown function (DUF3306)
MAQPESDGFLSRWSQRKRAVREGKELVEPELPAAGLQPGNLEKKVPASGVVSAQSAPDLVAIREPEPETELPPAPTMADVHELTPQSDFKPFMRADVAPDVKNAAMKQLFKDPHFNTMDMMDVYVDDYSKPDPLPAGMLRKMAVTQFLGFWKEEEEAAEKEAAEKKAREDAGSASNESMAQSEPENPKPAAPAALATEHDHTDLQLQPDDAAGRKGAFNSAGRGPHAAHHAVPPSSAEFSKGDQSH